MKAARQQAIVDLLINHSSLTTETLSKQLNVSRETIRRDLSELQAQGKVLRNHGRAKVIHQRSRDSGDPFHMRLKSHYAHKADIAREALARLTKAWSSPSMPAPPAGTSPASCRTARCTFLPTASPSAELAKRDQIALTCSGGTLQRKYGCYVNPALISQLKSLEIDLFIFPAKASTRRARCGTPMRSMPTSNRSCLSGRRSRCC